MSAGGFGRANLPYGIFRRAGEAPRVGVRFGDGVLDLAALAADGLLDDPGGTFAQPALNAFMARGPEAWAATRDRLGGPRSGARAGGAARDRRGRLVSGVDAEPELIALADVELLLPFAVADYVDFWSSIHH